MILFQPKSTPHLLWILTEKHVTVVDDLEGTSVTVPYVWFNTELHKRGFWGKEK